jgi:hypothetical protein
MNLPLQGVSRIRLAALSILLMASLALFVVSIRQVVRLVRRPNHRLVMLSYLVPNRQILARRIVAEAAKKGLVIEQTPRAYGGLEELKMVSDLDGIDVALIPGGVGGEKDFPHVRQVTALGIEALHVMVRSALYESATKNLSSLRGKRINGGPPGSVARVFCREVLRFAGVPPRSQIHPDGYQDEAISSQEALERLERLANLAPDERVAAIEAIPDAFFFLSPLPSLLGRRLASTAGYRPVSLPFTEAFILDRLRLAEPEEATEPGTIDRAAIHAISIPPHLYGTDPPIPPEPCRAIATHLLLVARQTTDPEAVERLLEVVHETPLAGLIQPPPVGEQVPQFPPHPGVELYLHRHKPILTSERISVLATALGGVGAFGSGIVGLYGFLRIMQLRRFESYYRGVRRIAQVARGTEDDPDAPSDPVARRAYLLDKLDDLRGEATRDFAEGGLRGEGLLAGVVALVNDTRASLNDTHSRDVAGNGRIESGSRESNVPLGPQ